MQVNLIEVSFSTDSLYRQRHRRKVQNQTVGQSRSFKIAADDGEVHLLQRLNGLQLDDDFAFNDKIESVFADLMIAVKKRDRLLPHKSNSADRELNGECLFVNGFQKSWPKLAMYRDCRRDD